MISVRFSFPGSYEKKLAALFFPGNFGAAGKQEAALPGGRAVPDGTGWKSRVLACILFPKNSEKYFCFPYNFGLTKQEAEGILIRP
ncbi:hypothetical protein DMI80_11595 [Akkermansia muciniphila]|nr:hypothetical protein DMI78_11580 [Akkermansia muciniphila]QHV68924.1 hypothetical protein DMI79_11640 [Akkermansia muciniphila]QHV71401.1 hypothetical protein DMI80_11595 [Akkermansia muciniphila]QHV73855.1 hypothetical protein DMI81_11595 [Akkermansia muciniphila]